MRLHRHVTSLLALAALSAPAAPQIEWLETSHNFGAIREADGPVGCVLLYVNRGTTAVSVVEARASCGCTTPTYARTPVEPGDTGSVAVTYDPEGRPGRFDKKVTLSFSDGTDDNPTRSAVRIKGVVVGSAKTLSARYPVEAGKARLKTGAAAFGDVMATSEKSCYIECYNASPDTIEPFWTGLPPYITSFSLGTKVPPGEQKTFTLHFVGSKAPYYGLVTDRITFTADPGDTPTAIDAAAIVNEDFSRLSAKERADAPSVNIEPLIVDYGTFDPEAGTVSRDIEIANRGKSPLTVRRVYSTDVALTTDLKAPANVKPGKRLKVTVTVDPSTLNAELLNARLTVVTNDPANPMTSIRLAGMPAAGH
jgi:hypothetical protein